MTFFPWFRAARGGAPSSPAALAAAAFSVVGGTGALLGWSLLPDNAAATGGVVVGATQKARNPTEVEDCRRLGLPTPAEATKSAPVRLQGFLSAPEIAALEAAVAEARGQHCLGQLERNSAGRAVATGVWQTTYLHSGGFFGRRLPELESKLRTAIERVDAEHWGLLAGRGDLNLRTVEYHEYGPGGELRENGHYDAGSIITLDIMLAEPGKDFSGGHMEMPESGVDGNHARRPPFERGDALLFVSHKYHNVTPVTDGQRRVLVAELWEGPRRTCAHRCLSTGDCGYTVGKAQVTRAAGNIALLG